LASTQIISCAIWTDVRDRKGHRILIPKNSNCITNRLALLNSEHRLQILQLLRTTPMSLTTRWPTTWRRQRWP